MAETIGEIKRRIAGMKEVEATPKPKRMRGLLSTGSTLLNLAMSGQADGGYMPGKYYLFVGDSNAGKTFLALNCLAEASINPKFDNYRLIFDNGEDGALMNMRKYFGKKMADRLEPPRRDKQGNPQHSKYLEDLYFNLDDALQADQPCIYVQDSIDALITRSSDKKFEQAKASFRSRMAGRKGAEEKGSYGDGKAKENSEKLRRIMGPNGILNASKSIVILINQSRDNIGYDAMFNPKTRAGGNAPIFYATCSIWYSIKKKIKEKILNKNRPIGLLSKVQVKRSRITGKDRTIEIPIMQGVGVDDLGSCVDYLIEEMHWKKTGANINAPEFGFIGNRDELVRVIEDSNREKELRSIVEIRWNEIEALCEVHRKPRYV